MHKLVIMIEPLEDWDLFEESWPAFLRLVESMPGLTREATCRVDAFLYGERPVAIVHELYFESLETAQQAMASEIGRSAGRMLQRMTGGRMSLFFADHKQDDLENIKRFRQAVQTEANDPE